MKKYIFSMLFVLALIVGVHPAFALDCKNGNYGSDECWTNVRVSPLELQPVSVGTVLVYDVSAGPLDDTTGITTNDGGAFQVRVLTSSNASGDGYKVAGVAQRAIATGDRGNVLVYGRGKVRVSSNVTSGDKLFVSSGALAGSLGERPYPTYLGTQDTSSTDKIVAYALNTQTASTCSGSSGCDVFVTIR